jgi:hypothetical protein
VHILKGVALRRAALLVLSAQIACSVDVPGAPDGGGPIDTGIARDATILDAAAEDARPIDAALPDATALDAETPDTSPPDAIALDVTAPDAIAPDAEPAPDASDFDPGDARIFDANSPGPKENDRDTDAATVDARIADAQALENGRSDALPRSFDVGPFDVDDGRDDAHVGHTPVAADANDGR